MARTFAHISDLHVGRDAATDVAVGAMAAALERARVDEVLVTGDVTHRGRRGELATFERAFAAIRDRLVVVPGNHDRCGDDVARALMPSRRVDVEIRPGLLVVRVDSTAPHNAHPASCHGELTGEDLRDVERAVESAPRELLVVVMLHHHVLKLPEDHLAERLATWLGLPHAAELRLGRELVDRIAGRCDLVLHGHRHAAGASLVRRGARPLRVVNAGCTPDAGLARVVTHDRGRIVGERWIAAGTPRAASARRPAARIAA